MRGYCDGSKFSSSVGDILNVFPPAHWDWLLLDAEGDRVVDRKALIARTDDTKDDLGGSLLFTPKRA